MFGNVSSNKSNIYERDWLKFDWGNFILDYFPVDWSKIKLNAENSTQMNLDKINILLGTFAPLKRMNKYKLNSILNLG